MLKEFLKANLLDLEGDDQRLRYFEQAATSVAETLRSASARIVPTTVAALHDNLPAECPEVVMVEEAILSQWASYKNKHPQPPKPVIRAILLQALELISKDEGRDYGDVVYLTGISLLPHLPQSGENRIIEDLLLRLGENFEQRAAVGWKQPDAKTLPELPALSGIKPTPINPEHFSQGGQTATQAIDVSIAAITKSINSNLVE